MISVVCWKWETPGYRSKFDGSHVNALQRAVAKHYPHPHRFICVTNDSSGIDTSVEVIRDRADFEDVQHPRGGMWPSCYRRLRAFAPETKEVFGDRFVSIDLDAVVVADLSPLWNREEDFVGWRDPYYPQFCGSMFLLRAGSRTDIWTKFNPDLSPRAAHLSGFMGSDQAWISLNLWKPNVPQWRKTDGVYSYQADVVRSGGKLPNDARIVFFHGRDDPWGRAPQRLEWVRHNWGTV